MQTHTIGAYLGGLRDDIIAQALAEWATKHHAEGDRPKDVEWAECFAVALGNDTWLLETCEDPA